jgi:hypothetical protein
MALEKLQDVGGHPVALTPGEGKPDRRSPGEVETKPEAEPIG